MKQHKVSILQASNSIVQNAMDSIGVSVASMRTPSIRELREQRMFADQNKLPVPDNKDTLQEPQKRKVPKKMDEEIFNRKMEEKWGPVNDNTSMPWVYILYIPVNFLLVIVIYDVYRYVPINEDP